MKCYLCDLASKGKCDSCGKDICKYHIIKGYKNKQSKRAVSKKCYTCHENSV